MKNCKHCGTEFKPKHNAIAYCSDMCREMSETLAQQKWLKANVYKRKETTKKWRDSNKETVTFKKKENYKKDPTKHKNWHLKNKFNIDLAEYNLLLVKQNNTCAICNEPETKTHKGKVCDLAVDHCHETGRIRGLLCFDCNTGIGKLKDSIELLKKAIEYLQ